MILYRNYCVHVAKGTLKKLMFECNYYSNENWEGISWIKDISLGWFDADKTNNDGRMKICV